MPSFYDHFRACAERWPSHVALEIQRSDRMESYTYAQVRRMAESVGSWLNEHGLKPGDRAAILADNHPFWVAIYLGVIVAGGTVVPLDTALRPEQIAKLLKDSGTSLLFSGSKYLQPTDKATSHLPLKFISTDNVASAKTPNERVLSNLSEIFATDPKDFSPQPIDTNAVAALLYTSGTTADPKGVMLTHANLLGEVDAVFSRVRLGPEDALLGVLPLFHVLSQMANLLLPLVKGSRVVYLETLNTTELLRALSERRITAFAVVPQFFYLIHERIFKEIDKRGLVAKRVIRFLMGFTRVARKIGWNPGKMFFGRIHALFGERMRYLVTGGSRFDPQIGQDFYSLGIDVLQAYGLTETTGGAFLTLPHDNIIGSVGPALAGVEGRIVDPHAQEDGGQAVGEIAIRGAVVMKGYWNRPDATAAAIRDGWLHTGDLGYFDPNGNLFITGRKKEVIVLSNGKNIYPEEVESHYLESPYIKEICVIGLEGSPSDPNADKLHAVIVPNFETLKQKRIVNTKEVIRYDIESLSASLPSTKRIGSYEIWQEDLPRTTTRKLKRFEIEKRVRENYGKTAGEFEAAASKPLSAEDEQWLARPEVQQAIAILKDESPSKRGSIAPNDNLELDLGLDSMQRIELLVVLEQKLGGSVQESQLAEIYTVKELVNAVLESAAQGGPARQSVGWKTILAEETTDPDVLELTKPRRFSAGFLFVMSRLIQMLCLDRFELRANGVEKLPAHGPFILSSNHQSYIDPFVMTCVLPWPSFSRLFSVGTSEIFGTNRFMLWLARFLRVIVVDPDANLVPAMRAGAYGLRHGKVLILYPEGERSIDGAPKNFKKGAAILSTHLQVPIVPVAIDGFEKVWPRTKPFQGSFPLRVKFGDPIYPPPAADASEVTYEQLTGELKSRVVTLWRQIRDHHES
ncbi:MAG TPA: AMP-binding protein [Terriglobales bacterium]